MSIAGSVGSEQCSSTVDSWLDERKVVHLVGVGLSNDVAEVSATDGGFGVAAASDPKRAPFH